MTADKEVPQTGKIRGSGLRSSKEALSNLWARAFTAFYWWNGCLYSKYLDISELQGFIQIFEYIQYRFGSPIQTIEYMLSRPCQPPYPYTWIYANRKSEAYRYPKKRE